MNAAALLLLIPSPRDFSLAGLRDAMDSRVVHQGAWSRGAGYKASFERGTATFVPFLGSRAPRNFPVAFRLESVALGGEAIAFDAEAASSRVGDVVAFDRGTLVELYDLAPRGVEQRFVLERLPRGGDLVLRIAVESELEGSTTPEGLRFANEHGSVLYGLATAIDARGRSAPADTVLADGAIEIRVAEAFLADAAFPLTIDPWISNFPVDPTVANVFNPDVSFDADSGRFLVVLEREFSASDSDVDAHRFDFAGNLLDSTMLDGTSTDDWTLPVVANVDNNNVWLVAAEVDPSAPGPKRILARTVHAQTFAVGPQLSISPTTSGDCVRPDVGGDPTIAAGRRFCVVWEREVATSESSILARLVAPDGTLSATLPIETTFNVLNRKPRISKNKANGPGAWAIVWERGNGVWAARVQDDATVVDPAVSIDTGPRITPVASSPLADGTWLLASRGSSLTTSSDIHARLMSGLTTLDDVNVSLLMGPPYDARSQDDPAVDADDNGFVLTFTEKYSGPSGTDYDVVGATLTPIAGKLFVSEGHVVLDPASGDQHSSRVSTRDSSGNQSVPGRAVAVWTAGDDVEGALYDLQDFTRFCFPGEGGVVACPCGNPGLPGRGCDNSSATGGARIDQVGTASLAADTVILHTSGQRPTATSIVAQFAAVAGAGLPFGQGVRCGTGTLKRLYVKAAVGGQVIVPSGGDLTISARSAALGDPLAPGSRRVYLVYYRDPTILGGCPASSFFNATHGGLITWRP